jgi:hypothetical protein
MEGKQSPALRVSYNVKQPVQVQNKWFCNEACLLDYLTVKFAEIERIKAEIRAKGGTIP